jgi:hypothetical protein
LPLSVSAPNARKVADRASPWAQGTLEMAHFVLFAYFAGELEILRQQFGRLALEIEVRQDPALAGHLEVETEVNKAKFLDM